MLARTESIETFLLVVRSWNDDMHLAGQYCSVRAPAPFDLGCRLVDNWMNSSSSGHNMSKNYICCAPPGELAYCTLRLPGHLFWLHCRGKSHLHGDRLARTGTAQLQSLLATPTHAPQRSLLMFGGAITTDTASAHVPPRNHASMLQLPQCQALQHRALLPYRCSSILKPVNSSEELMSCVKATLRMLEMVDVHRVCLKVLL